ncbi:MAG: FAD-binding protein, partial [Longimicrobiales bacterium]
MPQPEKQVSRRTALKIAVAGGAGMAMGCRVEGEPSSSGAIAQETLEMSNDAWFAQRVWSVSANKVLPEPDGSSTSITSLADSIYRPRSAEEIAALVRALPPETPIACVCGGHEPSGVALVADHGAVIFDLMELKGIAFEEGDGERLVTVGSGVVFRELVEAVREQDGALPVGTGPGVGVVGYTVNGGLSGYFSRRLGLLGQRAVRMTVVMADGTLRT